VDPFLWEKLGKSSVEFTEIRRNASARSALRMLKINTAAYSESYMQRAIFLNLARPVALKPKHSSIARACVIAKFSNALIYSKYRAFEISESSLS
jgi:hypothetical protein